MGVIASGHCAEKVEDQIREAQTVIDAGVDAVSYTHLDVYKRQLLVASDSPDLSTVEDYVVEIDRETGAVVWEL